MHICLDGKKFWFISGARIADVVIPIRQFYYNETKVSMFLWMLKRYLYSVVLQDHCPQKIFLF